MIDDPPAGGESPPNGSAELPVNGESPFASLEMQADDTDFGDADADAAVPRKIEAARFDLVLDIPVKLSVELGRTDIPIREVVNLGRGSIIELDRGPGTPLDVRVNGVLVGRGEVVLVNEERLGLRFVEVVSQAERMKRLS